MGKKSVSIIIPAYNCGKYIGECADSILAQTCGLDGLEVILVDDNSTDNTWQLLQDLQTQYPDSVTALHNQENRGCGGARNCGLDIARGDYIMFVDADDWLEPAAVEHMLKAAEDTDCDMVQCEARREPYGPDDSGLFGGSSLRDLSDWMARSDYVLNHYRVNAWARLFRRDYIERNELRFPEQVAYEDVPFDAVNMFTLHTVYMLDEALYHYRTDSENGITDVSYNDKKEEFEIQVADYMEAEYKRRGLWDMVRGSFWLQYQYYIVGKCYLDTKSRMEYFIDRQREKLIKNTLQSFPDVMGNYYLTNMRVPINRDSIKALRQAFYRDSQDYKLDCTFRHICLAIQDRTGTYGQYVAATMLSVAEHTSNHLCFHILHDDTLSQATKDRLQQTLPGGEHMIFFHYVDRAQFDLDSSWLNAYSTASLYRLIIPDVLPDLGRVIYLDADLLVCRDVEELWQLNMDNYSLAAVRDVGFDHNIMLAEPITAGLVDRQRYFNSGVLVMNLDRIRAQGNLAARGLEYLRQHPNAMTPDQDALNVLFRNDTLLLEEYWNSPTRYSRDTDAGLEARVYHYMGEPTINYCRPREFDREYLRVRARTAWGYAVAEEELFKGMFAGYDKLSHCQQLLTAMSSGDKKRIYYCGGNGQAMDNICRLIPPHGDDYFIGSGGRFGFPDKEPEAIKEETPGSFIVLIVAYSHQDAALVHMKEWGLVNFQDYFIMPGLLTSDQGGFLF